MSKKIVKPLLSLTSSANRIASGDLANTVGNVGSDEILRLSKSFDDMRERLAGSLEEIRTHNTDLKTEWRSGLGDQESRRWSGTS